MRRRAAGSGRESAAVTPAGGADEPPPLLGRWGALYAVVLAWLLANILFLAWLTGRWS